MFYNLLMFLRRWLAVIALAVGIALVPSVVGAQQVINYESSVFDCDWLDREYQRIMTANEQGLEVDTSSSILLARVLTFPLFVLEKIITTDPEEPKAPPLGRTVIRFSGDINDVAKASVDKNCYFLSDKIIQDERTGKHNTVVPAPIKSRLSS